ncbi:MAG: protein kinase [Deltaproteobacteria bacterium]|nr:protein kinase [Deltaproteobacteria bacterium]
MGRKETVPPPPPPERVGNYTIGELLGTGGTGSVYRAIGDDGARVAVKLFDVRLRNTASMGRFQKEATIRIDHPNVVTVLGAGTADDGTPYIVLELLEGRALSDIVSDRCLTPAVTVDLGIDICIGLAAAHAAGVVHRDLKPENIFICDDGTLKILDFGIALLDTDPERVTNHGMIIGTPWYLSPEQASGAEGLDHRTDLWSVGALLYEALAGQTPFEYEGMLQTVLAILRDELPPLRSIAPHVPPALAVVIERCLVKDARFRWSSADALRRALEEVDVDVSDAAAAATAPVIRATIAVGEKRLVAVLFADNVSDPGALRGAVEDRGGQYLPLYAGRAVGLFGGESWEGDELSRAVEGGLAARGAAHHIAVVAGHAMGHGAGISGEALAAAELGAKVESAGVVIDARSAKLLDAGYAAEDLGGGLLEVTSTRRQTSIPPMPLLGGGAQRDAASPALAGAYRDSLAPPAPDFAQDGQDSLAAPAYEVPLIGRSMEVAQIDHALRQMLEGRRATAVLVVGPTGIGKSRLREEMQTRLAEHKDDATVLFARAETLGKGSAFSLLAGALNRHARIVAGSYGAQIDLSAPLEERRLAVRCLAESGLTDPIRIEETVPFLGELLGVHFEEAPGLAAARNDPRVMAERIRLAVRDLFAGLAAQGPLTLALEDVQWSDDATLDIVEELVDYLVDMPFLAFLTARPWIDQGRPDYLGAQGVIRIKPSPLLAADVVELATALGRRRLSPEMIRRIGDRCGGNPLFVEQTVAELLSREFFGETTEDIPLPLTVEAAVQSRLDHLPPLERTLCRYAAVLGRPFSVEELEALGVVDAAMHLDSLARRDIIVARAASRVGKGREYRFRVGIVSEVAYEMLGRDQRSEAHRRVAEVLAHLGEAGAEELAVHFEKGGERGKAADRYARAALDAGRQGDVASVARCSDKALEYGVRDGVRFELRMSRAMALQFQGLVPEALDELEDAIGCAIHGGERARVQSLRGLLFFRTGNNDVALDELTWAIVLAQKANDTETTTRALLRRASVRVARGELDDAAADVEEAGRGVGEDAPLGAHVMEFRAYLANGRGEFSKAQDLIREAITILDATGDMQRSVRSRANLADSYNSICAYEDAEQALRRAVQDCRRVGNRLSEGWASVNLGRALIGLERCVEAKDCIADAIQIGRDAPDAPLQAVGLYWRGWAHLAAGDAREACKAAEEASSFAASKGLATQEASALGLLASVHIALAHTDLALKAASRGIKIRDEVGVLDEGEAELFLAYGRALAANGHRRDATDAWAAGRQVVARLAMGITDDVAKDRFLAAPTNRALLEAGA